MLLAPRKTKHRKVHKGKLSNKLSPASRGIELSFGSYGLKATEAKWITARQIESARRAITRYTSRGGKVWVRIFPHKPITAKSAEVGMGKGKGAVDHYVVNLKAGKILFEIDGVTPEIATEALRRAGAKLPVKTKLISKY
ncbi:50S ribosomal protein L16 [bacterium]|nr:50S ribosomal protein L16 [Candidatus Elulimicrobium humile]